MKIELLKEKLLKRKESGYAGYVPQDKHTNLGRNTNIAYLNWPQPR